MFELAFRGHRENNESLNKGNYLELLELLGLEEKLLKEHLLSSTIFKGTSVTTSKAESVSTTTSTITATAKSVTTTTAESVSTSSTDNVFEVMKINSGILIQDNDFLCLKNCHKYYICYRFK